MVKSVAYGVCAVMYYRINIVTYGTWLLGLPCALGALETLEPLGVL